MALTRIKKYLLSLTSSDLQALGTVTTTGNQTVAGVKDFTSTPTINTETIQRIKQITPVAVSGTAVDFTGIPSWAKEISIVFTGVSTNGTSTVLVQIGDLSGIKTTSYNSTGTAIQGGAVGASDYTTGFGIGNDGAAAYTIIGTFTLISYGVNGWSISGSGKQQPLRMAFAGGHNSLSSTLDRIRITTVNGTDVFDAGQVSLLIKG